MRFRNEKYLIIIDNRGSYPGGRYDGILHKKSIGTGYYFGDTYNDKYAMLFPNEKAAIKFAKELVRSSPSLQGDSVLAYRGDEAAKAFRSSFGGF